MKKIIWHKVTWYSQVIAIILFVGIFALGFCLGKQAGENYAYIESSVVNNTYTQQPQPVPGVAIDRKLTVTGVYTCLPHKDPKATQTEECIHAVGVDQSDAFFALSMNTLGTKALEGLSAGDKIKVEGQVVYADELSSNHWQKYNLDGIIEVTVLERF